jgi:hypothetical protein
VTHERHAPPHVPDLLLERYRLGEMTGAEKQSLGGRLASDPELRERLRGLEVSDAGMLTQYPPAWLADQIRQRAATRTVGQPVRLRRLDWKPLVAASMTALLVVVVGSQLLQSPGQPTAPAPAPVPDAESVDRIKGQTLQLFRRTTSGSEVLSDGATARRGDVIRMGYRAEGRAFGVIVSIDGRGTVTWHLPERGGQAVALGDEGQILLDHAYELDDAPRWEVFYFVSGRQTFDVASVERAVRDAAARAGRSAPGTLELPRSLSQSRFVLMKEVGR